MTTDKLALAILHLHHQKQPFLSFPSLMDLLLAAVNQRIADDRET